jgi:hypothetical protein
VWVDGRRRDNRLLQPEPGGSVKKRKGKKRTAVKSENCKGLGSAADIKSSLSLSLSLSLCLSLFCRWERATTLYQHSVMPAGVGSSDSSSSSVGPANNARTTRPSPLSLSYNVMVYIGSIRAPFAYLFSSLKCPSPLATLYLTFLLNYVRPRLCLPLPPRRPRSAEQSSSRVRAILL